MMEYKDIEVLIGVAAADVRKEFEKESGNNGAVVTAIAAAIATRINEHFTGKNPMNEKVIAFAKMISGVESLIFMEEEE